MNAESLPNLQGTQFIKVSTDLGVHGVDPSDKTYRKILGVVPILDSSLNAPTVFYLGEVQQPFYFTVAEPKLDSVQIQLLDDHDRPLRIFGDWMVELTVEFQEPESLDRYESLATFSGPAIDYAVSGGDPGQYRRLHRELSGRKRAVDGAEQSNRVSHAARTHGAHRA